MNPIFVPSATSCSRSTMRRKWSWPMLAVPGPKACCSRRARVDLPDAELPRMTMRWGSVIPINLAAGPVKPSGGTNLGRSQTPRRPAWPYHPEVTITITAAGPTDIPSLLASADALIRTDAGVFDADATNLTWATGGGPAYCAALVTGGDDFALLARDEGDVIGHFRAAGTALTSCIRGAVPGAHVPGVPIDLRRPAEGGSVRRPDCCAGRRSAIGRVNYRDCHRPCHGRPAELGVSARGARLDPLVGSPSLCS